MHRRLALALLVLAAVLAGSASPVAAAPVPPPTVKLVDCSIESRTAVFHARMRQIAGSDTAGSETMWLRYTLLLKGVDGYEVLKAPGLGRWRKSKPGVGAFGYRQVVRGLKAGAVYRAKVDYRWYDGDGDLLTTARRRSRACRQFDALPNLKVAIEEGAPARKSGIVRYHVDALNTGVAPALTVPVELAVDGDVVNTVTIATLLPAERRALTIHGPGCARTVEATIDPDGVLVESSESDNVDRVDCAELG